MGVHRSSQSIRGVCERDIEKRFVSDDPDRFKLGADWPNYLAD